MKLRYALSLSPPLVTNQGFAKEDKRKGLIILPGLGDGLRTVKGTAAPMSLMYRKLASKFTVYAFSRINDLPEGYTTEDMAKAARRAA